jgi:hypothetical protein
MRGRDGGWEREPTDVVELDVRPVGPEETLETGRGDRPQWMVWAGRLITPVLLLALAGAGLALGGRALIGNPDTQPSPSPSTIRPAQIPPATNQAWATRPPYGPGLLAPPTGRPGQSITVVGFRDLELCGPTELLFDSAQVPQRVDATARPLAPGLLAVFIVMQVPETAGPGPHRIELWGPTHGGRRVCGDVPVHQDILDGVDIEITS